MRYLNSNIKSAADPCTNFQEYVCGYFGINTLYDVVLGNKNTNMSTHSERYAEIDRILLGKRARLI